MQSPYLTVAETATVLGISNSGVYKLISRGKLPAVRRSERGTRISRIALDSYRRRLEGHRPSVAIERVDATLEELRASFEAETKLSPAAWEQRWKSGGIDDTAENMRLAIRALTLVVREEDEHRIAEASTRRADDVQALPSGSATRG